VRGRVKVDLLSLAAGAVTALVGALVLFDSSGALDIPLGWMGVALAAALGAILLFSGLGGDEERHD